MANENLQGGKELISQLKEAISIQGDFRDILKDSIKELQKAATSYEKIRSNVESLNKSTINTREIEKNITKNTKDRYNTTEKLKNLNSKLQDSEKREAANFLDRIKKIQEIEAKRIKAKHLGDVQKETAYSRLLRIHDNILEREKQSLTTDQLSYAQALKSDSLYEETDKLLKDKLNTEEQLEKSLGKTGKLIGYMNTKFGLFKGTYEKLVETARDGDEVELKKLKKYAIAISLMAGLGKAASKVASVLKDKFFEGLKALGPEGGGPISKIGSTFSNLIKDIPIVGGFLAGLADTFFLIADILIGINDYIVKAARNLGITTAEATKLYEQYSNIAYITGDIFITSKKMFDSQIELGQALGVNNKLSTETLETNIKLKDITGLEAGLRADIAENAIIAGETSEGLISTIAAQVKGLQKATGISFNNQKILGEANKLGGYLGLAFAKYPGQITKALVTTKALGTSLKEMDGIADSFLDFESSISKEFEAQLLTGKDINLQEARRMFLNNDLAGAALEINKQLGSSQEFLDMNRISATSLAESFGMSRDQMGEMLKKQELLSRLGAEDTDNARTQLKLGLEKYKTQEALSKALGEDVYNNLVNASTQEKIAAYMDKIKTTILDFIERSHLMEKIENFVNYLTNPQNLKGVLNTIKSIISGAVSFFGDILAGMSDLISYLPGTDTEKWENYANKIRSGTAAATARINSLGEEPVTVENRIAANEAQLGLENYNLKRADGTTQPHKLQNIYVQPHFTIDGQSVYVKTLENIQSTAPGDNNGGQWFAPKNYSYSGQQ